MSEYLSASSYEHHFADLSDKVIAGFEHSEDSLIREVFVAKEFLEHFQDEN